jgi:hypothetical protein
MKRWRTAWTATALAALIALPVAARGQTPAEAPAPSAAPQNKTLGTPEEHLKEADAAVKSISSTAVSSKAAARIAELKQHLNALQTVAATQAGPSAAASSNAHAGHGGPTGAQWSVQAAAADKIIGELLSDAPAGAIGPSTAADTKPSGGAGGSATTTTTAAGLDEETRARLTSARASLMAFAAAMGGAESGPKEQTQAPAAPGQASDTSNAGPATAAAAANAPAQPSSAAPSAESAAPKPAAAGSAGPPPNATAAQGAGALAPPAGSSFETAKQALTAARDSLSQLTKLPAVQQLTGEPRTQISQLITSFNALITATTDWRAAYAKVDAHLTALVGPAAAEPQVEAPAAGTAAAATDGLDPVLKGKLGEFRTHLKEFEKAASASPGR